MKNFLRFWVFVFFISFSSAAGATVFTVDRTDDPDPATANSCDDAVANDCSLRGAILKANTAVTDDEIVLHAGTYTLSIPNASASLPSEDDNANGDLDIKGNLTLTGDGAATTIIDGNHTVTGDRVLDIDPGSSGITVAVSGVTITGGKATPSAIFFGAGNGGGIAINSGTVSLDHVDVRNNFSGDGGPGFTGADGGGFGGGMIISGNTTATLSHCTISGNITGNGGNGEPGGLGKDGAPGGDGGGVFIILSSGSVTMDNSTISGNQTGNGGAGVAVSGAAGSVGGAGGNGGGLQLLAGTLTLKNVTVANNKTGIGGVGGPGDGSHAGGNGGGGGRGGGINTDSGTLTLNNVTLTGNQTDHGGAPGTGTPATATAGFNGPGGGMTRAGGTVTASNTLIAGNAISTSSIGQTAAGPDCNGNFVSSGFNLIGTGSGCAGFTGGVNNDLVDIDTNLDPAGLKDNGGDTETIALLSGSQAIDRGQNASCETTDQRGLTRPVDGDGNGTATCDIGAYEAGVCGDGAVQPEEGCDDGNLLDGDGCSAECLNEEIPGTTGGGTGGETTAGGSTTGNGSGEGSAGGGCNLIR